MTLVEYYGLPEGTKATMKYASFYDGVSDEFPCPENMSYAFYKQKRNAIKHIDTSSVTNMENMFNGCLNLIVVPEMDTSNVTTMNSLFHGCGIYYCDKPNWNTSNVTNMENLFNSCQSLIYLNISNWDTSKVTSMYNMIYSCSKIREIGAIDCGGLSSSNKYPFTSYSDNKTLTKLGGFLNAKMSWDNTYGLYRLPNLTYESCINVLNGLYDFTGNGETPTSSQGKLKVHKNFLDLVGDEISIGTGKGWVITS